MTRRDVLRSLGFTLVADQLSAAPGWDIRHNRTVIFEAYNPPFYPVLDYEPRKAIEITKALNADSFRYPAASYYAYFPTKTKYPVHPELKGDPMKETLALANQAGLRKIAYLPLNHPFMEVTSKNPNFAGWTKRFADGKPMTTEHYGFVKYYEGCLNSPVRAEIKEMVRETLVNYDFDVLYFDGPYMGMQNAKSYCHCEFCRKAYGRPIPRQDSSMAREDEIAYTEWLANDVVIAFLREIAEMIKKTRPVPVLFNDTSLLSKREWRNRAIPFVDGFMFEAAETPEEKLFNLELGHSTGKVIWTYVGTHTQYNREHMKNERVRGWFSAPVESEELLLDGATALAAGTGLKYWGVSRFFYEKESPLAFESGREVKAVFDFAAQHADLFARLQPAPLAGVCVSPQTIDWYEGEKFVGKAYENAPRGAWHALKDAGFDARPFLDYLLTPEQLASFKLVYLPNVACLSDAQCAMLRRYVEQGGHLIATHMTSVADQHGRVRKDFGLADLFGASLVKPEPVEIPDLYWQFPDGREVPQDPQAVQINARGEVLARTRDRGHRRMLGPAIIQNGRVLYVASSPEAIFDETRMKVLRAWFASIFEPRLGPHRTYKMEHRSGLLPHLMRSEKEIVLHLMANTGNKFKKLRAREEYLPVDNVRVAIRIPQGKRAARVSLLRAETALQTVLKDGYAEVTVPRVLIHEAVKVVLA